MAVTYESTSQIRSPYNLFYTIIKSTDPIRYTFGGYVNESFYDFEKEGYATDSPAFLTTGPITAQEPRTRKGIPYLTLFSFVTEEAGEALKSSCLFRSKWDWTTAEDSHRWTSVREAYRRPRLEDSITILSTRNKVRGHGKAVSFSFESQPGKNMHLYGWSFDLVGNNQE